MSIIEALKSLIGYSGNDIDMVFAILASFIVIYVMYSLFAILLSFVPRR